MKNLKLSISSLVIILMVVGCATSGNQTLRDETEISVDQKIIEGVTTAAEIKAMFGSPFQTDYTDGGLEIWRYEFANVKADAINYVPIVNFFGSSSSGTKKELVILFNEDMTVKRSSMAESDVQTKTGLFR